MTKLRSNGGHFPHLLCIFGALVFTTALAVHVGAQTNAAAMAVRQRVEGLQNGPAGQEGQPQPTPPGPGPGPGPGVGPGGAYPAGQAAGKLDTRFISPNAAFVIVLRPAQLMASPIGQVFPVEVATTAGQKYLGFDPAEIEEITAFAEPMGQAYGVTFKFKNPIRASSIPPMFRAHAQLADLNGKKYLRSSTPQLPSFYGANNKTLVVATDAALQQLVAGGAQPKTGPAIDRLRETPSGSDLFMSFDLTSFRPMIQIGLAQAEANIPAPFKADFEKAKPYLSLIDLVTAFELTVNASTPGPTSLVVHCTDDAAAQKLESSIQEGLQKLLAPDPSAQPMPDDPVAQGIDRYKERMLQLVQPQRSGTTITCLHVDGQNPAQQQLVNSGIVALTTYVKLQKPEMHASKKAKRAKAVQTPSGPGGQEGQPVGPDTQPGGQEGQPAAPPEAQPQQR